jgi:SEC-C motif
MGVDSVVALDTLIKALDFAKREGEVIDSNPLVRDGWQSFIVHSRFGPYQRTLSIGCLSSEQVSAKCVEDFVNESQRAGAHMSVLAVSSKFGQEVMHAAAKGGIGLLPFHSLAEESIEAWADLFKPALHCYNFGFSVSQRGEILGIPEEPALLAHFMRALKIIGPGIKTVPHQILEDAQYQLAESAVGAAQSFEFSLPDGTRVIHPNSGVRTPVRAFSCTYRLVPVCLLTTKDGLGVDPYLLGRTLEDELLKRNRQADPAKIHQGFHTTVHAGNYYYNPKLQFSYYCESSNKRYSKLVLVESYQAGNFLQARFEIPFESSTQFVEITESLEVGRLAKLYERYRISDQNLEGRFTAFVRSLEDVEVIDELRMTREQERAKKADYFFQGRRIIAEFKSLRTDTSVKINEILAPYRETPEWPVFYGPQDIQTILSYLPDRTHINKKIVNAVTDSIEAAVENANRQIRTTKKTFGLPNAHGLLVIFNEVADILSPNLVAYRVQRSLTKKTRTGEVRFLEVAVVLILNARHYTHLTPTLKGIPILTVPSMLPKSNDVEGFVSKILPQWAQFDGQPLFDIKGEDVSKLTFEPLPQPRKRKTSVTRQELWRMQYQGKPYLRGLQKEDLLHYGRRLFEDIGPRFLRGAPRTPARYIGELMERFTHLLEEINFRAIDMRELISRTSGLKEKLEGLSEQYKNPQSKEPLGSLARRQRVLKAYKNKIGRGAPCPCNSGKTHSRCHGRKPKVI